MRSMADTKTGRSFERPGVLPVWAERALTQLLPSRPRSVFWRFARQQQIEIEGMAETCERVTSESLRLKRWRRLEWNCLYTKKRPSEWPPGAFAF